MIRGNSS